MKTSKPVKILVGVLTLLDVLFPFVIMMVYIVGMGFFMYSVVSGIETDADPEEFLKFSLLWMLLFPVMMCYSLVNLGLRVFYIIHEIKNRLLSDDNRIVFVLGTVFIPVITTPIYFLLHIWKDNPQETDPISPAQ